MPRSTATRSAAVVEEVPIPEPTPINYDATHEVGDIVRLHEYVGSAAKQKLVLRVIRVPDPKARRKNDRECYAAEPIAGGQAIIGEPWMFVPGSAADKALAARTVSAPRPHLGWIVTTTARLRGFNGPALVVTAVKDDKATLAVLDGDGAYWPGVPVNTLTRIDLGSLG